MANLLGSSGAGGVLMVDQVDSIRSRASDDVIAELAERLPQNMQLAVTSRTRVRQPVGVLRAQGTLLELTAADLAMDQAEAVALRSSRPQGVNTLSLTI